MLLDYLSNVWLGGVPYFRQIIYCVGFFGRTGAILRIHLRIVPHIQDSSITSIANRKRTSLQRVITAVGSFLRVCSPVCQKISTVKGRV